MNHATTSTEPPPDAWYVARCACGHITVNAGPLHTTFSAEEFAMLHRLVTEAMREMRIAPLVPRSGAEPFH